MERNGSLLLVALLGTFCLHCAKAKGVAEDSRGVLTWQSDIAPLFAARCAGCHGAASPAGQYDLTRYLGVLGNGTHAQPDALAGDESSVLVQALNPAAADAVHQAFADLYPTVLQWVVDDRLAYFTSSIHGGGILNVADPQFHGEVLKESGWDFSLCARCHGEDFSGGAAQKPCLTCHSQGVTASATCHGRYGQSESHPTHLDGGALQRKLDCAECHVKPTTYTDVGHLFDASGNAIEQPATVTFGPLASTPTPKRQGPPSWDPATQTCSNVYCHGDAFADANATNRRPRFDLPGTGQAACGTCHGLPPSNHGSGSTPCSVCHGLVVDANQNLIDFGLHLNGAVDLGDDSGTCSACHGDSSSAAPPRDLAGNTSTALVTVGAHRSHVQALHRLSAPVPCGGCHVGTPSAVTDPGHIDSPPPAKVFPDGGTGLAFADGAAPSWDRTAATCAGSYCHGGGTHLADDASAGLHRTPVWTSVGTGEVYCGSCHGIPPQDGVVGHDAGTLLTACAGCHPATMDSSGAILVTVDGGVATSAHINGVIDVVP